MPTRLKMKQQFEQEQFDLINVGTLWQTADILTKPFTSPTKWEHALRLMSIGKFWIDGKDGKARQVAKTPACAANVNDQGGDEVPTTCQRLLFKFCCSEDSKLCAPRAAIVEGLDLFASLRTTMGPPKAVVIG